MSGHTGLQEKYQSLNNKYNNNIVITGIMELQKQYW